MNDTTFDYIIVGAGAAGGLVSNFTGEGPYLEHQECLAAAPRIYAQLVPITAKYSKFANADDKRALSTAAKTLRLSRQAPDAPL